MTTHPLNIGFLSTVHPHPWAPAKGVFNRGMLSGLAADGARISAVIPVPWPERIGPRHGFDAEYPASFPTWWYLPKVAPLRLATTMRWSLNSTIAKLPRPDLVLGYWVDPDGTVAAEWAESIGVPFVQMVGGSDILQLAQVPSRSRRMMATLDRADQVITIGDHLRNTLIERGIAPAKVSSMLRGVDTQRFNPGSRSAARARLDLPNERPILCWAGRMVPVKGLDVLLDALTDPELAKRRPLVVLIGDGPLRSRLERRARSLPGVTVRFQGRVAHAALPDWYRAADLMVLPSRSEGVPNVLLESLACGTGFVASDVGSIAELTLQPDRDLVPPGNAKALAEQIRDHLVSVRQAEQVPIPDSKVQTAILHRSLRELASLGPIKQR